MREDVRPGRPEMRSFQVVAPSSKSAALPVTVPATPVRFATMTPCSFTAVGSNFGMVRRTGGSWRPAGTVTEPSFSWAPVRVERPSAMLPMPSAMRDELAVGVPARAHVEVDGDAELLRPWPPRARGVVEGRRVDVRDLVLVAGQRRRTERVDLDRAEAVRGEVLRAAGRGPSPRPPRPTTTSGRRGGTRCPGRPTRPPRSSTTCRPPAPAYRDRRRRRRRGRPHDRHGRQRQRPLQPPMRRRAVCPRAGRALPDGVSQPVQGGVRDSGGVAHERLNVRWP